MKKYYDDPKYNAAFDRCIDVMAKLMLKYGSDVLEKQRFEDATLVEVVRTDSEHDNCLDYVILPDNMAA